MSIRKNSSTDAYDAPAPEELAQADTYVDEPGAEGDVEVVQVEKAPRKQTAAGRLGAADKAVKKIKAKITKTDAAYEAYQEKRNLLADELEEAERERANALAAFTEGS